MSSDVVFLCFFEKKNMVSASTQYANRAGCGKYAFAPVRAKRARIKGDYNKLTTSTVSLQVVYILQL